METGNTTQLKRRGIRGEEGRQERKIRDAEKQHFVQLDSPPTSRDTIDTRDVSVYELSLAVVDCHYFYEIRRYDVTVNYVLAKWLKQ